MSENQTPESPDKIPRWRRALAVINIFGAGFCAYGAIAGFLLGKEALQISLLAFLSVVLFVCGHKLVPR